MQAIRYEVTALRFLERLYGIDGAVLPPADAVLRGATPSTVNLLLIPFFFNSSLLAANKADESMYKYAPRAGAAGHLIQFTGQQLGSTATAAQLANVTDSAPRETFTTSIVLQFQRTTQTVSMQLSTSLSLADQISFLSAFLASILLVGSRLLLKIVETLTDRCGLCTPPGPPSELRQSQNDEAEAVAAAEALIARQLEQQLEAERAAEAKRAVQRHIAEAAARSRPTAQAKFVFRSPRAARLQAALDRERDGDGDGDDEAATATAFASMRARAAASGARR